MLINYYMKKIFCLIGIVALCTTVGCDKLPDLSDYFPGMKKEEKKVVAKQQKAAVKKAPVVVNGTLLARVNDWVLTKEEFDKRLEGLKTAMPDFDGEDLESKQLVLEELIRQELLVQEAERSGLANKKEIKDAVEEFRKTLLVREIAARITKEIKVGVLEAQDYYNANQELFAENAEWHIREIVVGTQEEAKAILIDLLKGSDFASVAQEKSTSPTASAGGDLGYIGQLPFPQMQSALATLEKGDISSVFKGPAGYYIIKLEDKRGGDVKSFSELREEIQTGLTLIKQQQAILDYIDKLKEKADIIQKKELLR